jgi:hypothetical protein
LPRSDVLAHVDAWHMTDYYVDIDTTPEPLKELGPAANPSVLGYLAAYALLRVERRECPRPPYPHVHADEGGNRRDLTKAEQEAFYAALEQALEEAT